MDRKHEEILIYLKGLNYCYSAGQTQVIKNLDLTLKRGDRIGIIAPNGSGKTTLFYLIMGLIKPDAGIIEIFGQRVTSDKDFAQIRQQIGLLFQDSDDQLFSPTVLEDVTFGPLNLGKSPEEAKNMARSILKDLGLAGFENRITHQLSGGEKRLVSLATVLVMEPKVLLLDEPTTGLDAQTKTKLISVLNNLDLTYLVISHEFDFIKAVTTRIFSMEHGRILFDEELHIHHHEHIHKYGQKPHKHI